VSAGPDDLVASCRAASVALPDGRFAVRDLTLDVARGETLVLLGRSGSGKTTTLKLLNALLLPTSGEVVVEGRATGDWEPHRLRRRIGYVIQDIGLFPHFTVERNVGLLPTLERWEPQRIRARVRELLVLVGLEPHLFLHRFPRELSGGQRQRVGIARALAADPALLLLDEPFGALDPLTRAELQREFKALGARLGKTIVFVTHDVREALQLGSRLALLADGRAVFVGVPGELRLAEHPEARAFAATLDQ
jgi:osmoprotectant transport system ATP-binding protein